MPITRIILKLFLKPMVVCALGLFGLFDAECRVIFVNDIHIGRGNFLCRVSQCKCIANSIKKSKCFVVFCQKKTNQRLRNQNFLYMHCFIPVTGACYLGETSFIHLIKKKHQRVFLKECEFPV